MFSLAQIKTSWRELASRERVPALLADSEATRGECGKQSRGLRDSDASRTQASGGQGDNLKSCGRVEKSRSSGMRPARAKVMRLATRVHEGMMSVTGMWGDGKIGVVRFVLGYYSRFLFMFVLAFAYFLQRVIMEKQRDQLAQRQKDERKHHGRGHDQEACAGKAVHAY